MDLTSQQTQQIQEIEKQVDQGMPSGPRIISENEVKDKPLLTNLLASFGIFIAGTAAVIVILHIPFPSKKNILPKQSIVTETIQVQPNITVTTQYINPFSDKAQYDNPFIASQNPFANLTQ